ncbi:MAG: glucose 1-dehydrogenase [Solirubrobacteraceae bacterium]|jgi:NAD(P)-dependent dehydrogenase (short-subunit alcohol dehydrogenase family)
MSDGVLNGSAALVTGATRGIGAAVARALDAAGARVALSGRDRALLDDVAAGLTCEPVVLPVELRDPNAPGRLAAAALDAFGTVDILVNNAAMAARVATTELTAELIDAMYAVNVRAPLLLIGAVIPAMRRGGGGSIINLSSVSGVIGTPRRSAYGATKGAIDAATRSLAAELGPDNIRVNAVAPGVVDTQLWANNKAIPGVIEQVEQQTPLRRWSTPEDVADAIVFLATPAARFITGETICVDGGMAHTLDLYSGDV